MPHPDVAEWDRYCDYLCPCPGLGFAVDISRVAFPDDYFSTMSGPIARALDAVAGLEAGGLANADQRRQVGHYWLRAPELAPDPAIGREIRAAGAAVREFAERVRSGAVGGAHGPFHNLVHVGIGGSAVGPQLLCDAATADRTGAGPRVFFLDNADPDGVDRVIGRLPGGLGRTLVSVVSKSGNTPTPWQVMLELEDAYAGAGLDFGRHAVATTIAGSRLDDRAAAGRWLARFPLWDWVGGRTSVTSAVGLLPAAVQGADVDALLAGAAAMDALTRGRDVRRNPAALLALMWHRLGEGRGAKNMVVLPYRDRLALFPRYVQQLVMESVGKRLDRDGRTVHQGLTVYGHKGISDQHTYLQQLREGTPDFFVTFIVVHRDGRATPPAADVTLGDHLFGGWAGSRAELYERGRESITITLPDLDMRSIGALIALYERAVGLYVELINVNGYHQSDVDKHADPSTLDIQRALLALLRAGAAPCTAAELAAGIGETKQVETVYHVLEHLARDGRRPVVLVAGASPRDTRFAWRPRHI